jgi:hypothetical protein
MKRNWLLSLGLLFGLLGLGYMLWQALARQSEIFPFSKEE